MPLKDYFDLGRKQELEYERKKRSRFVPKAGRKTSPYSPARILIGLGVLFQIVYPHTNRIAMAASAVYRRFVKPTHDVIITDIKMASAKLISVNPEWEKYQQWDDLARGKR